ncbi:MAG: DUF4430 domain-containing protein [Oscillospiraceae bacterium]|nr:DUF4430 domain-containing protein [Oscillospiraceae bacterium]
MKKNGKLIGAVAAVVVLVALFAGIWYATRPAVSQGAKTITVEVVHKDESKKEFTYHTDAEYLGEVLQAEGLVKGEQGDYGLYIKEVDGEMADYDTDGAYWAFYQGGEYASLSVDQTPVHDGDAFSLVYTVG